MIYIVPKYSDMGKQMKTLLLVCGGVVVTGAIVLYIYEKRRGEKFTIHEVDPGDKGTCVTPTSELPSNSDSMNVPLQPNSVRIAVQGYNYQDTPIFYRDGKKIVPMEYAWNANILTYYFTLAAPDGVCGNTEWILETYDFVEPIVINQDTNTKFKVLPLRRRHGYNKWLLQC